MIKDYGMFTEQGNAAVHGIVTAAIANNLNWAQVHKALNYLSENKLFEEAMDTVVRESVFYGCQFHKSEANFYI